MSRYVALDIETVANPAVMTEDMMPDFSGRKGTKDPEKIARQIAQKKREWMEKAGLNSNFGKIVCISLANDSGCKSFCGDDETAIIKATWGILGNYYPNLVTFNGKSFDLPYLMKRSWFNDIKPSRQYDTTPFRDKNHFDVRLLLSSRDKRAPGKLAQYAKLKLGIDLEFQGGEVADLYEKKDFDSIKAHCEEDVKATWQLFKSIQGIYCFCLDETVEEI